jgi:thermostable 8-oxoguanine DNA glycosylase
METVLTNGDISTVLNITDGSILGRIVRSFGKLVEIESLGQYRTMTPDKLWIKLVVQVCVMGSANHIERLQSNTRLHDEFEDAVSLNLVSYQRDPISYLAGNFRKFSATRFPKKGAKYLALVLQSSTVFQNGKISLFEGLSHEANAAQVRDELIKRCPIFRLKSASDFMISVGLSHDVIALDTRVVGTLQKYLGYNLTTARIQSHRGLYFSLEARLREFCQEQNISLALLDRILFHFSNMRAIELIVKYPEITLNATPR